MRKNPANAALGDVEEQYRLLLESVTDYAIFLLDAEGKVAAWNAGAERIFGYREDEIIGQPVARFFTPEDVARGKSEKELRTAAAQGRAGDDRWLLRKDGTRLWVSGSATALRDDQGNLRGFAKIARDRTREKQAEEALRYSEERFRELFENAADAVYTVDLQGNFTSGNAAAERLTGYTLDELRRMNVADLLPPDELQRSLKMLEAKLYAPNEVYELELIARDGSRRAVQINTRLIFRDGRPEGVQGIARDLTEQKKAHDALKASEKRFRAITENSWDAVALLAPDGVVQYASAATSRLLGYTPDELLGRNAFAFMHPEDVERGREGMTRLLETAGTSRTNTFRLRHKDGSWRWIEGTATNLLAEPGVQAVVANFHDITEVRQRAADLAEEIRRKDEFLVMLAHELRNPLAPIRNAVTVLRQSGPTEADLQWSADVIERQVRLLTRLVDDLLDVSRITRGTAQLQREVVEAAKVVADAVETCRPLIDARKQQLAVFVAPGLQLEGDAVRLGQIVGNILTNASKYTPEQGHIWLTAAEEGGEVVLRVRDDGIGIRPEILPRVFDLFVQAEPTFQQQQGGLGIGLTLVKSLVEMHGGRVEAHSEGPGKGSEFVVRLPAHRDAKTAAPLPPSAEAPPGPAARRVLVVDDNIDAAETLALVLWLEGHEVRTVHEGSAVLEAARTFHPDVIILDIGLPGDLSGYELAPRLREVPGLEHVLLVALTGYSQEEDRQRAREAGFDHHLVKPADPRVLHALLQGVRDKAN